MHRRTRLFVLFLLFLFSLTISTPVFAATITVESAEDGSLANLAANSTCDLREAIEAANTNTAVGQCLAGETGADTIELDSFTVTLAAPLTITEALTIQNGTVSGDDASQLFVIEENAGNVTFYNVNIVAGYSADIGGGIEIAAGNNVTIEESEISGNYADGLGGGIYNEGTLTIINSQFNSNESNGGGAIYSTGSITINGAFFSGNVALEGNGGAIQALGTLNIEGAGFAGNGAGSGGGGAIYSTDMLTISMSMFLFNGMIQADGAGGAIYSTGGANISTVVFALNGAETNGGGLYIDGSNVTMTNSLLSLNIARGSGSGIFINSGSVTVTSSCIADNVPITVHNNGGTLATFTGNWWGAADGPTVIGQSPTGSGDTVSGNVDVSGFLTEPPNINFMDEEFSCFESSLFESILSVTKDDGQTVVAPGDTLTYTIDFTNTDEEGGSSALVYSIVDTLPSNTTFVSCDIAPEVGICWEDNGEVYFDMELILSPGESSSVTVTVMVNSDATGTIFNNVTVEYVDSCECPNIAFATDTNTIEVPPTGVPVIEVFQGGFTPIPNNTGTATFVGMAGTPIVSSFEIRNTGTANLTLTEPINLTGTGFTLVNSFGNTTVEPGSNTTFDVQCDAAADGMYTGSVSFGTNDPTANPFTFALECQVGDIIDVLPTTLPDGSVNTPYTQAITATGGSGSYTFAVTGGTLPPGLTLEADGTLSGTPTQGGTYNFTITATDTVTSFYGYRNYTVRIDAMVPTVPPPPPTPVCEDHNFAEGGVVRASTVDGIDYAVNCRILYQNGQPTQWLGGNLYNAGAIGIQGVLDLGVIQAVDIFSPVGMTYFEGGAVFCLRGQGTLIWMAAKNAPRVAEIIGSYTVDEFPGFTCSTLFEPGTLVLVRDNPIQ
ncbi:MAG TPA: putative Ig domain-containing protein [Oceanobacillus sp.]|nr:putative Ig domain-containing protein [Oceanobacillus sp.]